MKLKPVDGDPFAEGSQLGGTKLRPVDGDPFSAKSNQPLIGQHAANPEAQVLGMTLKGEADSGFNPAAFAISAGRLGDKLNQGYQAAKTATNFAVHRLIPGMDGGQKALDELMAQKAQEAEKDRLFADLEKVHPGSVQLGQIAPLLPLGPEALMTAAATEYGSPGERLLRVGAVAGGNALATGAGKVRSAATNRANDLANKVRERAAADAAAETASAFSAAGRAAQDTFRQAELLRMLKGGNQPLSAEQAALVKQLEDELAQKAADKLIPSAANKQATSEAYKAAIASEAERAAQLAADRLSGKEAKAQIMARAKRYWPGLVTGAAGWALGGPLGAAIGTPIGLSARPMFHATRRMLQNPTVQYHAVKPIGDAEILGAIARNPEYSGLLGYYFAN